MLKFYGYNVSSPSNKVQYCLNALALKYEFINVDLYSGEQYSDGYLALNPAGKVPVIDDDGFVLYESNAIIRYLCNKAESALYPKDLQKRAMVDQWCDFITGLVGNAFGKVYFNIAVAPRLSIEVDQRSLEEGRSFIDKYLPVLENQLSNNEYIVGDALSIADIALIATLDSAETIEIDMSLYPNLSAWRSKVKDMDFYCKGVK